MTKPTLYILKGLPASGKTTWAKQYQRAMRHEKDVVRVNKDDLRAMLHDSHYSPKAEILVREMHYAAILSALSSGCDCIVDDAGNLKSSTYSDLVKAFTPVANIQVVSHFLDVPVEECIQRDTKRSNGVGADVIRKFADLYIPRKVAVHKPGLEPAIICDVDGCLALKHPERDIFDYEQAGRDLPNWGLFDYLKSTESKVILLTGREERGRGVLLKWLEAIGLTCQSIIMRPDGDRASGKNFKMSVIESIHGNSFNVERVIDDDATVIEACKEAGFETWQISVHH